MKIDIGDYLITSDEMSWTLYEQKTRKEGKNAGEKYTVPVGYYADVSQLVEALARREIRMAEATTFAEAERAATRVIRGLCERLEPSFDVSVRQSQQ